LAFSIRTGRDHARRLRREPRLEVPDALAIRSEWGGEQLADRLINEVQNLRTQAMPS